MTADCDRVLANLGAPLPPPLLAHVAECASCREVTEAYRALDAVPAPAPLSDERAERIRRITREELSAQPARATPWWKEALLLAAVNGAVAILAVMVLGDSAAFVGDDGPSLAIGALVLAAISTAGAVVAMAPRFGRFGAAVVIVSLASAVLIACTGSGLTVGTRGFWGEGLPCFGSEVALSLVPLIGAAVLLTRSAFRPGRALLAGLSAGAVGLLVLHLHCEQGTASHLLTFHLAPWGLVALALVGLRRLMPTRSYAP